MRTRGTRLASAAVVAVMALTLSGCSYNRFVTQEEQIKAQWAQVENQLQRRNDLIPNLVETVRGTAKQEQDVYKAIADSRAAAASRRAAASHSRDSRIHDASAPQQPGKKAGAGPLPPAACGWIRSGRADALGPRSRQCARQWQRGRRGAGWPSPPTQEALKRGRVDER